MKVFEIDYNFPNAENCDVATSMFFHNPLSPNGDQHQFSPNNIHTLSRDKVMRIN